MIENQKGSYCIYFSGDNKGTWLISTWQHAAMFQRLTNLLFGEVEEVAAELKGANPCMTEADEEGWMIVNLPGKSEPIKDGGGFSRLALGGGHGGEAGNQLGRCANALILPHPEHSSPRKHLFPSTLSWSRSWQSQFLGMVICVWFCSEWIPLWNLKLN